MHTPIIARIDWARLEGRRPRLAGCNARLGEHGIRVSPPIARVTLDDGTTGFGWAALSAPEARAWIGRPLTEALGLAPDGLAEALETPGGLSAGIPGAARRLEYPLLDLAGKLAQRPVYALVAADGRHADELRVPCYDTSLYVDDLAVEDDVAAADLIAAEAADGWAAGHRAFKVKVGRGARHMPLTAGTRRDVAVIHAVREAIGPHARLMIDANNGYNLNLTRTVLTETATARVAWIEEPFHEDGTLYDLLKSWLAERDMDTLIADGEGDASPRLLDWARDGLIDVVQYDVHHPGFSRWLELGAQFETWGVRAAPHSYGDPFGNYAACHLAPALRTFEMVEWDEATVTGLDAGGYALRDGYVHVPPTPGFGLTLDEDLYARAVEAGGFSVA